jgi:hypothetical protein
MTTYTAEQQKANRDKWVAALRSGEFKQAKEVLYTEPDADGKQSYCCLGVACVLAIREGVEEGFPDDGYADWDQELPDSIRKWLGLSSRSGFLPDEIAEQEHLIGLNDHAGYTFGQIADVIESGKVKLSRGAE